MLALGLALCGAHAAQADDYADVNQLIRAGSLAQALERAEHYLQTRPRDPQMRFLKGVIESESGRTLQAQDTYTRLTEDFPELAEPYNNLAVLLAARGDYEKARAALESALRVNPSYATAHENLGDVYVRLASAAYARALQLDPANASVGPKLVLVRQMAQPAGAAR